MLSVGLRFARSCVAASTRPGSVATIAAVISSWMAKMSVELAVVALGPDVPVGLRVDQLDGDADAVARLADAAFEHVVDAELPGRPPGPPPALPL